LALRADRRSRQRLIAGSIIAAALVMVMLTQRLHESPPIAAVPPARQPGRPLQTLYHVAESASQHGWTAALRQLSGDLWREAGQPQRALADWLLASDSIADPALEQNIAQAAFALGMVSLSGVPGQIALGQLSDRIGREPVWAIGSLGFVGTYVVLLALPSFPSPLLLWTMVLLQGVLGYGVTSVFGAMPAEIFEGRHYGSIYGTRSLASIAGGAAGPWIAGAIHDATGSYAPAFWIAIGASVLSIVAIYRASPSGVRVVAGRMARA